MSNTPSHTNRLSEETSPYLLQHAHNPVDWYPWGDEALGLAVEQDRPILLSIGYSACHWCHVMERESFENEDVAALMNRYFVNIKVDREERPDLDDIYMAATVAMNHGQGGWPMTVFLTPSLEPVFAGTYFPPEDAHGRPGFSTVLQHIARAWSRDRDAMVQSAGALVERLRARNASDAPLAVGGDELRAAMRQFGAEFDRTFGGFGGAPKFPRPVDLLLLLRLHRRFGDDDALVMVRKTLDAMANGGIYDHLGGGFSRYATDRAWLVPHFEKMLYDNALLALTYLETFQVTRDPAYRRVAVETLDYVLREMTDPEGGFWSATDADSEGEEGKFFVWSPEETLAVLGKHDGTVFNAYYDVSPAGNWEGKSILNVRTPLATVARKHELTTEECEALLANARLRLRGHRETRPKPGLDDKVLTAWNGLMIGALAEGYRVLRDPRYLDAATRAAAFVKGQMVNADGRLLRTWRAGEARLAAYLEDYAQMAEASIDLYEAGGDEAWLRFAQHLADVMLAEFADPESGSFFHTARDHEQLILRYKDGADGPIPAPNAVAASVLARLSRHFDRAELRTAAIGAIRANGQMIARFPRAFARSLMEVDWLLEGPTEIALVGARDQADTASMAEELAGHFLPNRVVALFDPTDGPPAADLPLLRAKTAIDGRATLYVCRDYACAAPTTSPDDVQVSLPTGPDPATSHEAVGIRRSGRATDGGTARYAARYEARSFSPLGSTGLTVSRLGFGGYRVGDDVGEHREALARAVASGINLVDTAGSYMDGASERLIGAVFASLQEEGEIERNEIVVVSKVGYVTGRIHELARVREEDGRPFPDVVKVGDGLWHCIHPEFLEDQLDRSLDRLELTVLDVCLLHNPEYYLIQAARDGVPLEEARTGFARRVELAFRFFERQVADGRIGWYGVSSNTLGISSTAAEATSLTAFVAAAEVAGGKDHHMRVLQLPLNLAEPGAFMERDGGQSALAAAQQHGIAVLVNRPLNGIYGGGMLRFADIHVADDAPGAAGLLRELTELEEEFTTAIASDIKVPQDALDPSKYFTWGEQLSRLESLGLNLEQWGGVEEHLRHGAGRIVDTLDGNLVGAVRERWLPWRAKYLDVINAALAACRNEAAVVASRQSETFRGAIAPFLPDEGTPASLASQAIWVVANTPGVTCVLNGMRRAEYVQEALRPLSWPPPAEGALDGAYGSVLAELSASSAERG